MNALNRFTSSPFSQRLLLATLFIACLFFLASCGNNVAATPTPLSVVKLNGSWTFTPSDPPNPGISSMAGPLANEHGNGADTSIPVTGSLTITGPCMSDQAPAVALSGDITNPHDILYQIQLSGPMEGGTLNIDGQEHVNTNLITGTYTVTGGSCQITNASFTATRDGTNGLPEPPTTY